MASLVTVSRYQVITLDTTSAASAVSAALGRAQDEVEEYLRRPLSSEERTETLRLSLNGRAYPAATPITAVSSPSTASILDGAAIYSVTPDSGPVWPGVDAGDFPAEVTVTYTGGFSASTLPATIEDEIAWLAYRKLHVSALAAVPAGATSARVGDVAVTYAGPTDPGASLSRSGEKRLRPWRRQFV